MEGPELVVYAGGMAGGKTGQAILEFQRIQEGTHFQVQVFQPRNAMREDLDTETSLVSRSGSKIAATIIPETNPNRILSELKRPELFVLIDESHMFEPRGLKESIEQLLDQRRIVHAVTLTTDYGGRMFPITQYLLGRASRVSFHYGYCSEQGCTRYGNHSQLYIDGKIAPYEGKKLFTGDIKKGKIMYKPRCLLHYEIPSNAQDFQEGVIVL